MLHKAETSPLVLIVEDEPLIRLDIVLAFVDAGFSVIEVPDADQALRLLQDRGNIGLVFTDIELPGHLDGLGLAAAIKQYWPQIPVLVTSGRVREVGAGDAFFSKPYDADKVVSQARAMAA